MSILNLFRKNNPGSPTPVRVPGRHIDRSGIKYLEPGEQRYTLPWAVFTDDEGYMWINGNYPAYQKSVGTVQMRIMRTKTGVVILHGLEPQIPREGIPWATTTVDDLLPVEEVA